MHFVHNISTQTALNWGPFAQSSFPLGSLGKFHEVHLSSFVKILEHVQLKIWNLELI